MGLCFLVHSMHRPLHLFRLSALFYLLSFYLHQPSFLPQSPPIRSWCISHISNLRCNISAVKIRLTGHNRPLFSLLLRFISPLLYSLEVIEWKVLKDFEILRLTSHDIDTAEGVNSDSSALPLFICFQIFQIGFLTGWLISSVSKYSRHSFLGT